MKNHEELITEAMAAFENSALDFHKTDSEMVATLRGMNDAFIQAFITWCKDSPK
jgi:hypothetical protein